MVGRAPATDIWINEPAMSARHAMIAGDGDCRVTITDLGGRNGTKVSGARLRSGETTELRSGDPIQMGRVTMVLHLE